LLRLPAGCVPPNVHGHIQQKAQAFDKSACYVHLQVQSLLFLKRNSLSRGLFSYRYILVTLVGAILVAVFDGLT
jgi:hypothetical protein